MNRSQINKMIEHGGNTILNFDDQVIEGAQEKTGAYNSVQMPRGVVDWHSHPRKCKNDNMCAIGLPSPNDMINITSGALNGTQRHLVYSAEGTYSITVCPEKLRYLEKKETKFY